MSAVGTQGRVREKCNGIKHTAPEKKNEGVGNSGQVDLQKKGRGQNSNQKRQGRIEASGSHGLEGASRGRRRSHAAFGRALVQGVDVEAMEGGRGMGRGQRPPDMREMARRLARRARRRGYLAHCWAPPQKSKYRWYPACATARPASRQAADDAGGPLFLFLPERRRLQDGGVLAQCMTAPPRTKVPWCKLGTCGAGAGKARLSFRNVPHMYWLPGSSPLHTHNLAHPCLLYPPSTSTATCRRAAARAPSATATSQWRNTRPCSPREPLAPLINLLARPE